MSIERFSFVELEKQLEETERDVDKIEFISSEIVRCRKAIQDVKCVVKKIEPSEIKISAKTTNQGTTLVELLNSDKNIKRAVTIEAINLCGEKLCEEYFDFVERAEILLIHYKTKLEVRVTWNEYSRNGNNIIANDDKAIERIIWLWEKKYF